MAWSGVTQYGTQSFQQPAAPAQPKKPQTYEEFMAQSQQQAAANPSQYGPGTTGGANIQNPQTTGDLANVSYAGAVASGAASGQAPGASYNGVTPGMTTAGQAPKPYQEDLYSQLGGAYLAPTYTSQVMPGLQQQLSQPGQAEQFYQAAQSGNDPYYQRLQQQGMDALNQQMAARGHFNSGGAIAGLGNFQSGLAAQQYHQMGDLANQAQSQGQARAGLSGQLANMGDQGDLARLNGLFNQATTAQTLNQGGINSMLGQQTGIDQMGSGLMGQFYGQGGQLSGQSMSDAINAYVNAMQAGANGQQAQQQAGMSGLSFLMGL